VAASSQGSKGSVSLSILLENPANRDGLLTASFKFATFYSVLSIRITCSMKILITGVSSGIGLSLAELFQKEEVWGLSQRRPPERLSIRFSACDVTDWHQLLDVAGQISSEWGTLDALVHCAGTQGAIGPAVDVDPLEWARTVRESSDRRRGRVQEGAWSTRKWRRFSRKTLCRWSNFSGLVNQTESPVDSSALNGMSKNVIKSDSRNRQPTLPCEPSLQR